QQQPEQNEERRGPAVQAAFGADGQPTKAASGFARSCGVEIGQLERRETDKGSWLFYLSTQPGESITTLLPEILQEVLKQLPIDRRMRWGAGEESFVRPVHSLITLFGDDLIPCRLFGLEAGRSSPGHRFLAEDGVEISEPGHYPKALETVCVIADFEQRRKLILEQISQAAETTGGTALIDPDLLDEVTSLVEWPQAVTGQFDPGFLEVPAEALIAAMQDHQKYFPVVDGQGQLLPTFILISNLACDDDSAIRAGNERVLRARLADARFFWQSDGNRTLESMASELASVLFQQQLGTLADKSRRISQLARFIATAMESDQTAAERAGQLAKADLISSMVGEFDALQGIMGGHYALRDGESAAVASAIREQYLPTQAGGDLPRSETGQALALADKLDTLVGIFGIAQAPTGDKDPFALRRAALGVARICIEGELALDLPVLLNAAISGYAPGHLLPETPEQVYSFVLERLLSYYQSQGFGPDEIDSVLHLKPASLWDADRRIRAVAEFRKLPDAAALVAANKRIGNILRQIEILPAGEVDSELLREAAEETLATQLRKLSEAVIPLLDRGHYTEALHRMAALRVAVDGFFDSVMVMDEEIALRNNRIRLLMEIRKLFLRVSDLSRLQG
ncbi:MAG: glycine--tRNA ligase subunit beta, partial [Gammaproteobacteria bacterium]|nr:glycine--tRNA ligase subunit beta [Gammaproteobacteria bacterium]